VGGAQDRGYGQKDNHDQVQRREQLAKVEKELCKEEKPMEKRREEITAKDKKLDEGEKREVGGMGGGYAPYGKGGRGAGKGG
jgi:hypothetical protein